MHLNLSASKVRAQPHVRLRPINENDVHSILSWVNNPDIVGNLASFSGEPFTEEQELAYIEAMRESESDWVYSIIDEAEGRYLGQIGIHQIHERSMVGRLSVVIGSKENMSQGYGSAAIRALLNVAFKGEGSLHKVWLMVFETNLRAQRTYKRLGFKVEGCLRDEYFHNGEWHNMIRMSLLASEWK